MNSTITCFNEVLDWAVLRAVIRSEPLLVATVFCCLRHRYFSRHLHVSCLITKERLSLIRTNIDRGSAHFEEVRRHHSQSPSTDDVGPCFGTRSIPEHLQHWFYQKKPVFRCQAVGVKLRYVVSINRQSG